jgi:hypothetical protein
VFDQAPRRSALFESDAFQFQAQSGLWLDATSRSDSAVFDEFFAGYDRAFVLPNEKEDADGFRECLELNHGQRYRELEAQYGVYRELCLVARVAPGQPAIGGANFIAGPVPPGLAGHATTTANLNYIFVNESERGRGRLRALVAAVQELVARLFADEIVNSAAGELPGALVFIEQNDPLRMSPEDYHHDTQYSGIDQLDRLRIWARLGARVVDFPYVQPALSAEQAPDPNLVYSVLGATADALDASVLAAHLRRFFGVSVLKGGPLEAQPAVIEQLECLAQQRAVGASVGLLDPAPLLARVTPASLADLRLSAPSLRAALRT